MAIKFYSQTNSTSSGTNRVDFGRGVFQSGGVVSQGFYMSNGIDTDYEVQDLQAWLGEGRWSQENENNICEYDYRCEMNSKDHSAVTTKVRALILAEIDV